MEQKELDVAIHELEERVDRLRALYDQYFMGYERLEPSIARKDVERRFVMLRKEQIRNTAQRFRFNVITQKYNTYAMYWQRICRQIEEGSYKRHIQRAKKRFGDANAPGDRDLGVEVDVSDFDMSELDTDTDPELAALLAETDAAMNHLEMAAPPPPTAKSPGQVSLRQPPPASAPRLDTLTHAQPLAPRLARDSSPNLVPSSGKPRIVRKIGDGPPETEASPRAPAPSAPHIARPAPSAPAIVARPPAPSAPQIPPPAPSAPQTAVRAPSPSSAQIATRTPSSPFLPDAPRPHVPAPAPTTARTPDGGASGRIPPRIVPVAPGSAPRMAPAAAPGSLPRIAPAAPGSTPKIAPVAPASNPRMAPAAAPGSAPRIVQRSPRPSVTDPAESGAAPPAPAPAPQPSRPMIRPAPADGARPAAAAPEAPKPSPPAAPRIKGPPPLPSQVGRKKD